MKRHLFVAFFSFLTVLAFAQSEEGIASYYGDEFDGRKTASGEIYDPNAFTAADRTLRFGMRLQIINLDNGKWTVVTVNDRGPYVKGRLIDLSKAAAIKLGMIATGTAHVKIIPIPFGEQPLAPTGLPQPAIAGSPAQAPAPSVASPQPLATPPPVITASTPPEPQISGTKYIQVGAFGSPSNAQIFAKLLNNEGFHAHIHANGGLSRVFLVADDESALAKLKKELRAQGHNNFLVVHQEPVGTEIAVGSP